MMKFAFRANSIRPRKMHYDSVKVIEENFMITCCKNRETRETALSFYVFVVCRYSALSSVVALDISETRNRSLGRSSAAGGGSSSALAAAAGVREYQGRLSGPSSRSSLTPKSSQEKNFDTPVIAAAAARYVHMMCPLRSRRIAVRHVCELLYSVYFLSFALTHNLII